MLWDTCHEFKVRIGICLQLIWRHPHSIIEETHVFTNSSPSLLLNTDTFPLVPAARPRQIDLGFVVDSSDSVGWSNMQRFISSMVESFDISEERVHVGFIVFSDRAVLSFGFNELQGSSYTLSGIRQLINRVSRLGGSERRVDLALNKAYRDLFSDVGGTRVTARKVIKLIGHFENTTISLLRRTRDYSLVYSHLCRMRISAVLVVYF